jgi:hypothetical protein
MESKDGYVMQPGPVAQIGPILAAKLKLREHLVVATMVVHHCVPAASASID